MDEPSNPGPTPHTPSRPVRDNQLSRLVPSTSTSSDGSQGGHVLHDFLEGGQNIFEVRSPQELEVSNSLVRSSSTSSSIAISPTADNGRFFRRRGSSRSSMVEDEDEITHPSQLRLVPQHMNLHSTAGSASDAAKRLHKRDVSADITAKGMALHSRESSTNSPIPSFQRSEFQERNVYERPCSSGAWSNTSLTEDYATGLTGAGYDTRSQHSGHATLKEDDDRVRLNRSSYARLGAQQTSNSNVDIESTPQNRLQGSRDNVSTGPNRAKSTRKHYLHPPDEEDWSESAPHRRSVLSAMQKEWRRMSARVVNIRHRDETIHTQLADDEPDESASEAVYDKDSVGDHPPQQNVMTGGKAPSPPRSRELLRGRSLGLFGPDNGFRKAALASFTWRATEPLILLLIIANVVVLTIQAGKNAFKYPRPSTPGYFHDWEDYALFAIFVGFTIELLARIVVAGFVFNTDESFQTRTFAERLGNLRARLDGRPVHAPVMQRSLSSSYGQEASSEDGVNDFTDPDLQKSDTYPPVSAPSTVRTFASTSYLLEPGSKKRQKLHEDVPFVRALQNQRAQNLNLSQQKAFLRHSWNRVDLVAVCSFWIMFGLAVTGTESRHDLYIFRALAALRSARLLTVTTGTSTILRSLKQSAPLMVSVAFFVTFAMTLFSIVGVYSFKGSFKRSCVLMDSAGEQSFVFGDQRCGGHINATTGQESAYIAEGQQGPVLQQPKGYICPLGQLCLEGSNPYNGTESFDNIFTALLQIVIVTGANGWSDLTYAMIDAEYFVSCFFFIVCIILLNFWLMNIFVAVIINTFGTIREETKHSAFAGRLEADPLAEEPAARGKSKGRTHSATWRRVFRWTNWAWIAAIVADVGVQASKTAKDSQERKELLSEPGTNILAKVEIAEHADTDTAEFYFTCAFLAEIVVRFMSYFPNYRSFPKSASNTVDATLAVITMMIQVPVIRNSPVYPWLTVFQLMRFYRVILAVPRMRSLLAKVLSSVTGLVNMLVFLLIMNFVAAVIAVQFLRGQVPETVDGEFVQYSFYQIYNSFLAIYVIFSSEDWTNILYNATSAEAPRGRAWLSAIFLAGWFLFANFILLQMFIAVINEGFAIAEEDKEAAQMQAFIKQTEPQAPTASWITRLNPYRFMGPTPALRHGPRTIRDPALPTKVVTSDFIGSRMPYTQASARSKPESPSMAGSFIAAVMRAANPPVTNANQTHSKIEYDANRPEWNVDRQLELLNFSAWRPIADQDEANRRAVEADFILAHPSYDRSLWIFSQKNPIRRWCQRLVEPAFGDRLYGVPAYRIWTAIFNLLILCAIAGSVAIAATATPAYRRDYLLEYGHLRFTWFNLTEVALGFIFIIEFMVKVVADGFIFTPNAYLLSVWNMLDFFVLLTLLVNVGTALSPSNAATSRFTRSLKAFRALRLINLSETMRQTFYNVMIIGAGLIFDASVLTLLYIIPFSIWGQNLFSGLLYSCNDGDVLGKTQCVGEYLASPAQWEILVPRAWQNPYVWSFDSFRSAILILFEIVSLEGWVDVMDSAMAITGEDIQTQANFSQYNSLFFLIYNLIGAIVVLTLFVSVIIENFSLRSGQALLTSEQRQWSDLKKLIVRQRPSRRPLARPTKGFRSWCYDRAVAKHGWWSRMMTGLYVIHIGVLTSQTASQSLRADDSRDFVFLALTLVYLFDIFVRMTGLGFKSFWQSGWNIYDVFVVTGTFATTIPILLKQPSQVATQLQKLFLVSIAFKLVQKNNSLNQLFKTAAASLPAIMNVFGLWLTLFLVWTIFFLETFSLTRWMENETWMQNYSTFPRAMLMLAVTSTGEAWNAFMHDYTVEYPHCSPSSSYLFSDCGDAAGAFVLFITWNVISMYVFANMLTGVVVENFSFVFSLHGSTTSLTREEMRAFKKAWSVYDVGRTGYLKRTDFIRFFKQLTGIFDVKVYDSGHQIKALREACTSLGDQPTFKGQVVDQLDLLKLDTLLNELDFNVIAKRKRLFNRLYHEALLTEEPGRGISFTGMLLLLAQYKLVDPDKALQLDDLHKRKAKQQRVDNLISLERVRGYLQTIFWRRAFLAHRLAPKNIQTSVPEIVLQGMGEELPQASRPRLAVDIKPALASGQLTPTLRSPLGSTQADWASESSELSPRVSEDNERRPSMGADYLRALADSGWSKLDEEHLDGPR